MAHTRKVFHAVLWCAQAALEQVNFFKVKML